MKIICLTSIFNEEKNLPRFLENNSKFFDGFIFFDDCSDDGSIDLLNHPKTLEIIRNKKRNGFDDRYNRNMLLDASKKYGADWLFFLDADEDLHIKKLDLFYSLLDNKDIDVIDIPRVHLWNSSNKYRVDYPFSNKGIQYKGRLFRPKKDMVLNTRRLHFNPIPYIPTNKFQDNNMLLIHYGLLSIQDRKNKYENYTKKYDSDFENQRSYEHFLEEDVLLDDLENVLL